MADNFVYITVKFPFDTNPVFNKVMTNCTGKSLTQIAKECRIDVVSHKFDFRYGWFKNIKPSELCWAVFNDINSDDPIAKSGNWVD